MNGAILIFLISVDAGARNRLTVANARIDRTQFSSWILSQPSQADHHERPIRTAIGALPFEN